jgi:hypothetical protein
MADQLWKMAESRGARARGVDRLDWGVWAQSWRVEPIASVGGAHDLYLTHARGVGSCGWVVSFFGWLTGPGDGPMSPSARPTNRSTDKARGTQA